MPLRALGTDGLEYLTIHGTESERQQILDAKTEFVCPHCQEKMLFVNAEQIMFHFRHKKECPFQTEPETVEHLAMKRYFAEKFPHGKLEQRIENRITDFRIGDNLAVECQYSPISNREIIERFIDYGKKDVYISWAWGFRKMALNPYQHAEHTGECFFLDKETERPLETIRTTKREKLLGMLLRWKKQNYFSSGVLAKVKINDYTNSFYSAYQLFDPTPKIENSFIVREQFWYDGNEEEKIKAAYFV